MTIKPTRDTLVLVLVVGAALGWFSNTLLDALLYTTESGILTRDIELFSELTDAQSTLDDGSTVCPGRKVGAILAGTPIQIRTHGVVSTISIQGRAPYSSDKFGLQNSSTAVECVQFRH